MGPHEACFYCDVAMSYIDELIFSSENPGCKPLVWARYRDDCYDPWPHGEHELLNFTRWLNSINPNIQFTVNYKVGEGVEFLDTYIYDRDGILHTDLFSKQSDTHAYLPPSSCHPYHICKNNPNQVARRVRKICSENDAFDKAREKFSQMLVDRGYSTEAVSESFDKFANLNRFDLFTPNPNNTGKHFPLITEFNPHLPAVAPVINKHKSLLLLDREISKAIPQSSIFASYRQPKNLKSLLVHSKFCSESPSPDNPGCRIKDHDCFLCKHFLINTETFKSYECDTKFTIKDHITCETEGVIYLLLDLVCKKSYVGSTIDSMKTRMSNYKNHLKTQYKGCEMAQHFKECGSGIHSLYAGSSDVSTRSKQYLELSNQHLSQQLNVILIEKVNLSNIETTTEKRKVIEAREGFWQTQLRTLTRYGGLNKKDERKIMNKRLAQKTSSQPANTADHVHEHAVEEPITTKPQQHSQGTRVRQSARLLSKTSSQQ